MSRPVRIEYEGAFHHVMNRGRQRRSIFHDDDDYLGFLNLLSEVTKEYNAVIHAYCLMSASQPLNRIQKEISNGQWEKKVNHY